MKKLTWLLIVALALSLTPLSLAEGTYAEAPMLTRQVEEGALPPLEQRLPETPKVADELSEKYVEHESGNYGGTLHTATTAVNWSPTLFMGSDENLLTQIDMNSGVITPNILEDYSFNEDYTVFTFKLRKGLKWSDGEDVTMEDVEFCVKDVIFNSELTPVLDTKWRSGSMADGTPMEFEALSDLEFQITFDASYGGFLSRLCTSDSWAGYTDTIKPAHYLKRFHKEYAEECHGSLEAYYEFIAPFAKIMGYDDPAAEGTWCYVFNQVDVVNWELSDPTDCLTTEYFPGLVDSNFPVLYAWVMESSANNRQIYVRNPYYWKVDAEGKQLPYVDYVESAYIEDEENFTLSILAGDVDFSGVISADNMTLYLENEEKGNYTYKSAIEGATFGVVFFNINYGLNADGTVKEDAASQAWQEMVGDLRFRQALMYAIDVEETAQTIYNGLPLVNDLYTCDHDIEKANALLDEMGALDIDGDGFRETPSGAKFSWLIWMPTGFGYTSFCEFYVEYWHELGLNCDGYVTDDSIISTSEKANEIPMRIYYSSEPSFWFFIDGDIEKWAPLYDAWFKAGGMSGDVSADGAYLEPTEDVKEIYRLSNEKMQVDVNTAATEVVPKLMKILADQCYVIMPIVHTPGGMAYSNRLGNIPYNTDVMVHTLNFDMDSLYFKDAQ